MRGVSTSIEGEPLKSKVSGLWSVAHRKKAFCKNLTAELSCSFLAEGGGGIWHQYRQLDNLSVHGRDFVDWENSFGATLLTSYTYQVNRYPLSTTSSVAVNLTSTYSRDIRLTPLHAGTECTSIIFTTGILLKFFPALHIPSIPCAQAQRKQQNRIRSVSHQVL